MARTGQTSRGFTLLELLVVLAIGVLIISLVPPLLSGMEGTTELRAAARQLAAGLRQARNEAVIKQREATLTLDLERRRFTVTGSAQEHALPENLSVNLFTAQAELLNTATGRIRFFPDGSSTGGRIDLANKRFAYGVDVDWLTGRVRILVHTP